MELKFYRHKEHKDLFIVRTSATGGGETTEFYRVTRNVCDAIKSVMWEEEHGKSFMGWFRNFPGTCVNVVLEKNMEFDGYSGILRKEVRLPVSEFELVTLVEME